MKHTRTSPTHQPMFIHELKISTMILLHPEFSLNRRAFANRHGVDLVDAPDPETSFKKAPDDPYNQNRTERNKANIHLVRHGAINLFTERDEDGEWVRSIKLGSSMLLYDAERHPLQAGDLPLSLSILKDKVTPLLADPRDGQLIVPGLVQEEEQVTFWSRVDTEVLFPGIDISCFHRLSHPSVKPAEGTKPNRIQLGDKKDDCLIRIKQAKWEIDGPDGRVSAKGVRVRLILKGRMLTDEFRPFSRCAKVNDTLRLVSFPETSLALVHQAVMSRVEGTILPVPPEWADRSQGKPVTHAKAIALLSKLTPIALEELRAMDEELRKPSDSTRKLLNSDLPIEVGRLAPVPVATLFHTSAYASQTSGFPHAAGNINPMIAKAYA